MISKLFELENGVVRPSDHCYTIKWLKAIMDKYSDNEMYLKVYQYIFYMTYPIPDDNPYINLRFEDRQDRIISDMDIDPDFDFQDLVIEEALANCELMFQTPMTRTYETCRMTLENLEDLMRTTPLTASGKDNNVGIILNAFKALPDLKKAFNASYHEMLEEHSTSRARGGATIAYDQQM